MDDLTIDYEIKHVMISLNLNETDATKWLIDSYTDDLTIHAKRWQWAGYNTYNFLAKRIAILIMHRRTIIINEILESLP